MATKAASKGRRRPLGRQGHGGAVGPQGPQGARGPAGVRGRRGTIGKRGPRGLQALSGPLHKQEVLQVIVRHFDDVYHQLNVHMQWFARLKQQLDAMRTPVGKPDRGTRQAEVDVKRH